MTADAPTGACANEACEYGETGKCVEGNAVEECPYLERSVRDVDVDDVVDDVEMGTDTRAGSETPIFGLSSGKALSVAEGSVILKSKRASVVALVGQAEAGKTSLIGEVYDAFQYGQYEKLSFAGSRTLIAFEEICHKIRATSRGNDLFEERTDVTTDPVLFHLLITRKHGDIKDVLIADRSGETYRDMLDRPSMAAACIELRRASVLNLLVDGARLCDPSERASVITECQQTMQTLAHSSLIEGSGRVNVVLTKLDEVDGSNDKERSHSAFETIVSRVIATLPGGGERLGVYRVAARPHNELYKKGFGVEALLNDWLQDAFVGSPYESAEYEEIRAFEMVGSSPEVQ
ncbi:MAG: hypothetical protein OXF79_16525 [Chloroflexi bacterium]|nr:hypothetical protein [Chloroflexota bacterium]